MAEGSWFWDSLAEMEKQVPGVTEAFKAGQIKVETSAGTIKPEHQEYISGSTEPWTVEVLCALIKANNAKVVLETGTFEGKTTLKLIKALQTNWKLISIEHDKERWESAIAEISPELEDSEWLRCKLINDDALSFIQTYDGDPFDFVFLDDCHDATHVSAEIEALLGQPGQPSKMAPGGIIAVHDVIGPFGLAGVVTKYHGWVLDLPLLHAGGGLGLIQVSR